MVDFTHFKRKRSLKIDRATFCIEWKSAFRDRLNDVFGNNRVIGLGHDVEWPPRSPDITPCDFFLWGYIKDKVFSTPPRDIDDLRQKIIREFNALRDQPAFVSRAVRDMHRQTMLCVAREGGHVEGHGA